MHKLYRILAFLAFLCFIGCSEQPEPGIESKLTGRWEARYSSGGWGGGESYPPGNGRILELTKKTYKRYEDGNLIKQGQYLIVQDQSYLTGKKANFILFDYPTDKVDDKDKLVVVEVKHNELVIYLDANDGGEARYQKIQ